MRFFARDFDVAPAPIAVRATLFIDDGSVVHPRSSRRVARRAHAGRAGVECSLDLRRSRVTVELDTGGFAWHGRRYPFLETCKERSVYHWTGASFEPIARYDQALFKLVPTEWGPPTFEIDGIKMLPTARISPIDDARRKVALVQPRDRVVLDTCGGLGYFAACCLDARAAQVLSFEKHQAVIWLRIHRRHAEEWRARDPAMTAAAAPAGGDAHALPAGNRSLDRIVGTVPQALLVPPDPFSGRRH